MRTNRSPSAGSTIVNTLRPYEGGTGQTTVAGAQTALNLIPASALNQPNGIGGLDANGQIPVTQVPDNGPAPFGIQGPTSVAVGSSTNFTITNYDVFTSYTLTAISGVVDINNDAINYTAPNVSGAGGFILNGRQFNVAVLAPQPNTPTLAAVDVTGGSNQAAAQCTGSAYSNNIGSLAQLNTDWQVASDSAFNTIVSQSMADGTNLTSWKSGTLSLSTTYYVRCRYRDANGTAGAWSNTVTITTKSSYVINTEEAKFLASDNASGDNFGFSVSMNSDGSRVAVGAYTKTGTFSSQGAVYVFLRTGTTWAQEAKLIAGDPAASDNFGYSVCINSDSSRIIVGAYNKTGIVASQGAVYVFLRTNTTWAQEAKLLAGDPTASDFFGCSVATSNSCDRIVIGAYGKLSSKGAVYIFLRTGTAWAQEAKLLAIGGGTGDRFGCSVSLSADGSRVAIGAYTKTETYGNQGEAYIFLRTGTTWAQEANLIQGDPQGTSYYGFSIALNSDATRVVIGAMSKLETSSSAGAVYICVRNGTSWTQEAKLISSSPIVSGHFGYSVSVSSDGSRAVIGAPGENSGAVATAGATYVFIRNTTNNTWSQESKVVTSTAVTNDQFGQSVSMSGDNTRVIIGANLVDNGGTSNCGACYIDR